jgi:hypothetical protein
MSRHRFNELVEDYALGELDDASEQEFHDLIEQDEELAREARQTREMVRLARLAPKAAAPAGLLHGALAKARAQATDATPSVDTTPSANVILIPSGDGRVRRIPIHTADADALVAQADPQLRHSWRNLNWGLVAAALAAVVVGGLVAVELGPSLMGDRAPQASTEQEKIYLANSTVYETGLPATPSPNAARPPIDRGESRVGFAASLGRERSELFARQQTEAGATEAATLEQEADAHLYDRPAIAGAFGPVDDSATAPFGTDADLEAGLHLAAGQVDTVEMNFAASEPAPEAGFGVPAFSDEQEPAMMAMVGPSPDAATWEQPARPMAARLAAEAPAEVTSAVDRFEQLVAQQTKTTDPAGGESVVADVAVVPTPHVLTPVEVEFLLAQALATGGSEAKPLGVGFAPLVPEARVDGSRAQLTLSFPDRRAYESFLSRLEVTPVVAMTGSSALAESTTGFDSRRTTVSRGEIVRAPQNGRNLPSPVTGLTATSPTPASSAPGGQPSRASTASEWRLAEGQEQARDDAQVLTSNGVEVGKPLDLTRYRLHLTTDVQTGQVRVTVSPLQPGETAPAASPSRTPSAPPGARR